MPPFLDRCWSQVQKVMFCKQVESRGARWIRLCNWGQNQTKIQQIRNTMMHDRENRKDQRHTVPRGWSLPACYACGSAGVAPSHHDATRSNKKPCCPTGMAHEVIKAAESMTAPLRQPAACLGTEAASRSPRLKPPRSTVVAARAAMIPRYYSPPP
jgi:hypothetical protein